jgi:hypothetical protein
MDFGNLLSAGTGLLGQLWGRNQTQGTASQYAGMGAPYRERLSAISADPNLYYKSPEATALANASDRRYSSIVGNPAGSGTAQQAALEAMLRGYGTERDRLFNYGGGAYFNQAAPGAQGNATNAGMGIFSSLGPLMQLMTRGGGGSGGGDISGLLGNSDYMSGGGMGLA